MRGWLAVSMVVGLSLNGAVAGAQATPSSPQVQMEARGESIVSAPPSGYRGFDEHDLREAETRSRRVRSALIATSAGAALGAVLLGIGVSQCRGCVGARGCRHAEPQRDRHDHVRCDARGP